ncbi:hypothetical protein AGMMS50276_32680 [Synergistales bacterium]|nr:hypothetical protein AGMMS50276_32680 [Synergistales bacterium]
MPNAKKDIHGLSIEQINSRDIEQCRDLYNELMAFQKSKATIAREAFDMLSFDMRKEKYESAEAGQFVVAKDKGEPVGYVFSVVEEVPTVPSPYPVWAPVKSGEKALGFYPDWDNLPAKAGCLSNIYVREPYRAIGLGSKLFDISMRWFESLPDINLVFIHVSNGNDAAFDFYCKRGFTYSHDVFGGFIKAVYKFLRV